MILIEFVYKYCIITDFEIVYANWSSLQIYYSCCQIRMCQYTYCCLLNKKKIQLVIYRSYNSFEQNLPFTGHMCTKHNLISQKSATKYPKPCTRLCIQLLYTYEKKYISYVFFMLY